MVVSVGRLSHLLTLLTVIALAGCSAPHPQEKPIYQDIAAPTGPERPMPTSKGL
jgi:hypothetical protein